MESRDFKPGFSMIAWKFDSAGRLWMQAPARAAPLIFNKMTFREWVASLLFQLTNDL
jgi:hypothetical protein